MAGELDQSVISNGVTFMKYLSGERIKKRGERIGMWSVVTMSMRQHLEVHAK